MEKTETNQLVSMSQYARMRGLAGSTISRQCASGHIRTHDGMIDVEEADHDRLHNLHVKKGGPRAAPDAALHVADASEVPDDMLRAIYLGGFRQAATQLCQSARKTWPRAVADMNLSILGEAAPAVRTSLLALMIELIEGWCGEYVNLGELPEIDFSVFGRDADETRRSYEKLRKDWQ